MYMYIWNVTTALEATLHLSHEYRQTDRQTDRQREKRRKQEKAVQYKQTLV